MGTSSRLTANHILLSSRRSWALHPRVLMIVMVPLPSVWILVQATTAFPDSPDPDCTGDFGSSFEGRWRPGLGDGLLIRWFISLNVTSPWALFGFTKLNGYATGVAFTRNLVSGLGLHPTKQRYIRKSVLIQLERRKQVRLEDIILRARDVPGVEPFENGVRGPCKTSPSDEGDDCADKPASNTRPISITVHQRNSIIMNATEAINLNRFSLSNELENIVENTWCLAMIDTSHHDLPEMYDMARDVVSPAALTEIAKIGVAITGTETATWRNTLVIEHKYARHLRFLRWTMGLLVLQALR